MLKVTEQVSSIAAVLRGQEPRLLPSVYGYAPRPHPLGRVQNQAGKARGVAYFRPSSSSSEFSGGGLPPTFSAPIWLHGCAASLQRRGGGCGAPSSAPGMLRLRLWGGESRAGLGQPARGLQGRRTGSGPEGWAETLAWNLCVRGGGKF